MFSTKIDKWLDQGHGDCLLRYARYRGVLADVLNAFDENRYLLHSWIVTPNHTHLLFSLAKGERLEKTLKSWKGVTARRINRLRANAAHKLWMKGYFDRMIRDADHFRKVARYIRRNPDKTKLKPEAFTLYVTDAVKQMLNR